MITAQTYLGLIFFLCRTTHPMNETNSLFLFLFPFLQTDQIRVVNAFRHGMDSQQLQQATSNANLQRVLQKQASLGKRFSTASSTCQQEAAVAVASRLAKNAASKQAMAAAAASSAAASPPPPAQVPTTQLLPPSSCSISSARKFSASEQQQSYSHTETAV